MMQEPWGAAGVGTRPCKSAPCSPLKPALPARADSFHTMHKVPLGDTPYVRAKRVQLVDKDPEKAIALFWAAINTGDRVDSALKDMAIVMKQQNRSEEAIEAIRSLRSRCSEQAQESLDNILLDLYKKCGRLDDQIALLKHKLHLIQQGMAFNGKRTKTARSQGRKFQVSVEQEATRLLGNLGWALMQQDNFAEAEAAYRRALLIGPDNNKMCNLGICLMKQGRVGEARETLKRVRPAMTDGPRGVDSHLKAFERAQEMLCDLEESKTTGDDGRGEGDQRWPSGIFFPGSSSSSSSSVWQPQPCLDFAGLEDASSAAFGDENVDSINRMMANTGETNKVELLSLANNLLNVAAPPFYSKLVKKQAEEINRFQDPLGNLKRTRSGGAMWNPTGENNNPEKKPPPATSKGLPEKTYTGNKWLELLPDNDAFDEAIVAAVLAPVLEATAEANSSMSPAAAVGGRKVGKRLRVFEDITHCLSPKA